jgi:NAD(P)H-dependent FMN reductase
MTDPPVRILAVCGSLQARSGNRTLLETAARLAPNDVEVRFFEGLRALPHFDPDLEAQTPLLVVESWREAVRWSDALLVASPEYGHSLPGSLKNAVDWLIGTGELERKIVAITASVPHAERGRFGLQALAGTLRAVSATIVGGEPIVRGATFDAEVQALLSALACAASARRGEP